MSESLERLWAAVARRPDDVAALNGLGNALVNARRPDEAVPLFLRALELAPQETRLHNNLGLAYTACGQFVEAEAAYVAAQQLAPRGAAAHNNLGCLRIMQSRHFEALVCLETALQLDSAHAGARRNRALAYLALGDFDRGWVDYDWCAFGVEQPVDPFPRWQGQPLAGKRIVLTARQGLGDTLQFIRYAAMLKALDAHVILECPVALLEVLRNVAGVDECVAQGESLPEADVSVPLMALARVFHTTLATIPGDVPYLRASRERVDIWLSHPALQRRAGERLVGICWQGNPHHAWDRFRSAALANFEPLARIPGVRLISLQRGPGIEQSEAFQERTGGALEIPTHGQQQSPDDLADTAAIMTLLDLIITVDTAPAHLAGALGRPVWVALSVAADWRWLTERSDSPWYRTMRLFRQKRQGDWEGVIGEVCGELGEGY